MYYTPYHHHLIHATDSDSLHLTLTDFNFRHSIDRNGNGKYVINTHPPFIIFIIILLSLFMDNGFFVCYLWSQFFIVLVNYLDSTSSLCFSSITMNEIEIRRFFMNPERMFINF